MALPTTASKKDDFLDYVKKHRLDVNFDQPTKIDFRKKDDKEEAIKRIVAAAQNTETPRTIERAAPQRAPLPGSPHVMRDLSDAPATAPPAPSDRSLRSVKPELVTNPRALGKIESGRLLRTADFNFDMTQELLAHGAKMPEHVPLVSISFQSQDLGGDATVRGTDKRAGHDPWAVADYIRDYMRWSKDAIFIDAEQFGWYCDGKGKGKTYTNTPEIRPWCPTGEFTVGFPVSEAFVQNNYRGVFKWTQRVAPVILVFYSTTYYQSDHCFDELRGVQQEVHGDSQLKEPRLVVFVLMDEEVESHMKRHVTELKRMSDARHTITSVDISSYMTWLNSEGGKLQLKDAAFGLLGLTATLEKWFGAKGIGDIEHLAAERRRMVEKKDEPSIALLDLKGNPVRNRYLPEYERRIKLVKRGPGQKWGVESAKDLAKRLPGVGEKKAADIWAVIEKHGRVDSLDQLARTLSTTNPWQGKVFQQILPFISI